MRSLPLVALLLALSGCSVLPLESSQVPQSDSRTAPAVSLRLQEAVGVIHVHSDYSDGSLPAERIAEIAAGQGLQFIILTDHNTLRGKRGGEEGRRGGTLLLCDAEISTQEGHYLALGLREEVPAGLSGQETISAVESQGALGFIAHPLHRTRWKAPEARGMTGIEIYSAKGDVREEFLPWLGLSTLLFGSDFTLGWWLDRPEGTLALWDRMLARGDRVVGIGSPNAHGITPLGLRLSPYGPLFRMVRNHLLLEESPATPQTVYAALAAGRLFVAHDLVADARGFRFLALEGEAVAGIMGDEVKWRPGLRLYAWLPSSARIRLYKDGQVIQRWQGQEAWFEVPDPGVYRVEASRGAKPWIYSNPLYVIE